MTNGPDSVHMGISRLAGLPLRGLRLRSAGRCRLERNGAPQGRPVCLGRGPLPRMSQPIENLIGPEPLEPMQRLVEPGELVARDAADLLHRAHVLLVERTDDLAHVAALLGELDAHRAAVDSRALMIEEAHLDQLLEIV